MQLTIKKIKLKFDLSKIVHDGFIVLLPLTLFVLVRLDFVLLALFLVVASKWRMFAVKSRFWLINIRANAVDMLVGASVILFMAHSALFGVQLAWMLAYVVWITLIKPGSSIIMNALQAMIALSLSLVALFMVAGDVMLGLLVISVGVICYVTAHHFLDDFDEPFTKFLAYMWAFMGAAITWVLGHWLLYYGILAQPALILIVLGYGLGGLYFFDHRDKLSRIIKLEFSFIVVTILLINLIALAISASSSSII